MYLSTPNLLSGLTISCVSLKIKYIPLSAPPAPTIAPWPAAIAQMADDSTPDIDATVEARVAEALRTERSASSPASPAQPSPDIDATVEAGVAKALRRKRSASSPASPAQALSPLPPPTIDLMICGATSNLLNLLKLHQITTTDCASFKEPNVKVILYSGDICGDADQDAIVNFVKEGGSVALAAAGVSHQTGKVRCDATQMFAAYTNVGGYLYIGGYDATYGKPMSYFKASGTPFSKLSPRKEIFADVVLAGRDSYYQYRTFTVRNSSNCVFWVKSGKLGKYGPDNPDFWEGSRTKTCVMAIGLYGKGKFALIGGREDLGTLTGGFGNKWFEDDFTISIVDWLLEPAVDEKNVADDPTEPRVQEALWSISTRIDANEQQTRESLESLESSIGEELLTKAVQRVPVRTPVGWQSFDEWAKDFAVRSGNDPGSRIGQDPVGSAIHLLFRPEDLSYFIPIDK